MLRVRGRALRRLASLLALVAGLLAMAAPSAAAGDHILRLRVEGIIDQVNAAYVEEGLKTAAEGGAAAVIVELDSPGGGLTSMDRIVAAILNSRVPVIVYVAPAGARAGSAATFITLAADVAAMAPATNIGAASVVGSTGEDLPDTLESKVTNDAVARIRDLAARHGRNADWAEAAVREAASISADEAAAMEPPVVDIVADDTQALLAAVDRGERADGRELTFRGEPLPQLAALEVRDAGLNVGQQVLHVLADPNIAFILFTLGFYGVLAEFFHPNFFSGIAGAIALLLAFISFDSLPLNVGGLLLIGLAVVLFVLELHVTSYGLLTVGGVVSFVLGAFALYTRVEPGQPLDLRIDPILIATMTGVTVLYFGIVMRLAFEAQRNRSRTSPMAAMVGSGGTAATLIAPTGVAFAGGEHWSARSRAGQIAPGTRIKVVGREGLELIVEPADGSGSAFAEESHA